MPAPPTPEIARPMIKIVLFGAIPITNYKSTLFQLDQRSTKLVCQLGGDDDVPEINEPSSNIKIVSRKEYFIEKFP